MYFARETAGEQGNRKLQVRTLAFLKDYRYTVIENSDKEWPLRQNGCKKRNRVAPAGTALYRALFSLTHSVSGFRRYFIQHGFLQQMPQSFFPAFFATSVNSQRMIDNFKTQHSATSCCLFSMTSSRNSSTRPQSTQTR